MIPYPMEITDLQQWWVGMSYGTKMNPIGEFTDVGSCVKKKGFPLHEPL